MRVDRILREKLHTCGSIKARDRIFRNQVTCRFALEDGSCSIGTQLGRGNCDFLVARKTLEVRRR